MVVTEPQRGPAHGAETAPRKQPRRRFRWLILVLAVPVVLLGLPVLLKLLFGFGWWRVQVLRSADRQHVAELERLYGGIDGMFCVTLDGDVIHRSWDCSPKETIPFRETLAWDDMGNVLVFQLANEIVFAYDVPSQSEIHPSQFAEITLPTITLDEIGFEGEDELRRMQQETETATAQ